MSRPLRDVIVFAGVAAGAGWIGVWVNVATGAPKPMEGLGTLVWLVLPAAVGVVLTILAGNWGRRLGLGLGGPGAGRLYLLAVAATPMVLAPIVLIGLLTGTIGAGATSANGLAGLLLAGLGAAAVKNVFEELAWRGFLTPRLAEANMPPMLNHILTGLVWAVWHVPYWLFFVDRTTMASSSGLAIVPLIALAFVLLPMQALFYGELRLSTGSVWPTFLLHTVANGMETALLGAGFLTVAGPLAVILSPGTGGVAYSVLLAGLGVALWWYRAGRGLREAVA